MLRDIPTWNDSKCTGSPYGYVRDINLVRHARITVYI